MTDYTTLRDDEIDALCAERIMGWTYRHDPKCRGYYDHLGLIECVGTWRPSRDRNQAVQVVEQVDRTKFALHLYRYADGHRAAILLPPRKWCEAALAAWDARETKQ